jgi:hypothetical protein
LAVVQCDNERNVGIERSDAGEQASGGGSVEALGWLVEQQRICVPENALGDAQPPPLAA